MLTVGVKGRYCCELLQLLSAFAFVLLFLVFWEQCATNNNSNLSSARLKTSLSLHHNCCSSNALFIREEVECADGGIVDGEICLFGTKSTNLKSKFITGWWPLVSDHRTNKSYTRNPSTVLLLFYCSYCLHWHLVVLSEKRQKLLLVVLLVVKSV